ncbi:MAG: efflux RND transporter periplasmic adaptor subunit [Bacteroides sp.]
MYYTKFIPFILISTVFSLLLTGCRSNTKKNESAQEILSVRTTLAASMLIDDTETYSATVEPYEQHHVCPATPGIINKILVEVSDNVTTNDLLIEMDPTQLLNARVQLANLEKEFTRIDTLKTIGSATQQQYDQIKTQLDIAKASLTNIEKNTYLRAPISGTITGRYYQAGELFAMAPTPESNGRTAIVTIMKTNPSKVVLNIPEKRLNRLHLGQQATIQLDAYPNRQFSGEIFRIAPTIHPLSHTVKVEIRVPNYDQILKPGMFARATLHFGECLHTVVPDLAIVHQRGSNLRAVFIVNNGKARRVVVKTGNENNGNIEILEGVKPKDSIIISNLRYLQDGYPIQIAK